MFARVLDDIEMYEEQKPFTLSEFCAVSAFLNNFVFKAIWTGLVGKKSIFCTACNKFTEVYILPDKILFHCTGTASNYNLFLAAHTLLMVLYRRDCRRPFTPNDHWLIKDVKSSVFTSLLTGSERDRGNQSAQVNYNAMS